MLQVKEKRSWIDSMQKERSLNLGKFYVKQSFVGILPNLLVQSVSFCPHSRYEVKTLIKTWLNTPLPFYLSVCPLCLSHGLPAISFFP